MTNENERDNVALVARFFEIVFNGRRIEAIPEFLSPDLVLHYEHEDFKGVDNWKELVYEPIVNAIPDVRIEIEESIATGAYVVTRWTARGVLTGKLFGVPPSGEPIEFNGTDWTRIVDGKVVENWNNWSVSYLLRLLLSEVKVLRGILPLCSFCKKIRDDEGYWHQVDSYISEHSQADISHSVCPDCMKKNYPVEYTELFGDKREE